MAEARVVHEPERRRYALFLGEQRIGRLDYEERDGESVFLHVGVEPAFEGRGHGTQLVREALADARGRGLTVVPLCPFVHVYLRREQRNAA